MIVPVKEIPGEVEEFYTPWGEIGLKPTCRALLNTNTDRNYIIYAYLSHRQVYVGFAGPVKNNFLRMISFAATPCACGGIANIILGTTLIFVVTYFYMTDNT